MSAVKITSLELENVKRIRACSIVPTPTGLTVIGGRNNQGKTSILDAIAWALGGERYRPSQANRDGSVLPPKLHITLSNGIVVDRSGKNSELKVTDPDGRRAGQQLLNEFIEQLALDLPKFMEASSKEKANILLKIIGVGEQLAVLEQKEKELYNNRLAIGRIADQKRKFANEMPQFPEAPKELVSISELIQSQQEILARNGENQQKRLRRDELMRQCAILESHVSQLRTQLDQKENELLAIRKDLEIATRDALDLQDQSTEELERSIQNIEIINQKVRANLDKEKAEEEASEYRSQYDTLSTEIDGVRKEKMDLLQGANLPLEGLSVQDGELTYQGKKWDNLSGSDQLKVSTAIVRAIRPSCGFVLLDKLEQMDTSTLEEFGAWMVQEGLQGIATRVSTGGECSIIIEDGYIVEPMPSSEKKVTWKAGEF